MAPDSSRIDRLEREISALAPTVQERLAALESRPAPKPIIDRLWGLGEKAIIPVVLLLLGFVLKDSVEHALKRQQLELSGASQIQQLVEKLGSNDRDKSRAAAVTLATFGDFAVVALARELQEESSVSALAAEEGLRSLALSGSAAACDVLVRMIRNRTRLYDWRTHRRAIRLLGQLECRSARMDLRELQQLMTRKDEQALKAYSDLVKKPVNKDDLRQLREAVDTALGNLDPASR